MTRYPTRPGVPSENGWPMCNAGECVSVMVVPAAKKVPLRKGNVATILNAFIIRYNQIVEPITSQVWGWSPDNDVWNSNHMSATAIDINAPKYPWGARRMPAATIQKVRGLLKKFRGVVFWGNDWNYPDQMHFQIGLPPSDPRVAQLANDLNGGYLEIYGKPTTITKPTKEHSVNFDKLSFEQLAGYKYDESGQPAFSGWPCLGDRTVAEAIGAIGEKLGIPGCYDVNTKPEK